MKFNIVAPQHPDAPSTIYVSNGTFSPPYYFFYEDVNATIPLDITDQIFYKGNSYTFERFGVNNHPFYNQCQ